MRTCITLLLLSSAALAQLKLDDSPARSGDWGFRPAEGEVLHVTPPAFVWRYQDKAVGYEVEVEGPGGPVTYKVSRMCVLNPDAPLPPGEYNWRYRFTVMSGQTSGWSRKRAFTVAGDAAENPLPNRSELLARIPGKHPRLFLRPEEIPALREAARGEAFAALVKRCDRLLENPPPTAEPPNYPPDIKRKSEAWRKIWWGNREYTIKVLDAAATLAFTGLIAENDAYRALARRLLLDAAKWDPRGSTGYRTNDEAGMPYAYHFSRTYTFLNDLLTEEERGTCHRVMAVRGDEMFRHLCPRHFWRPYSSHANRAWHFLGEAGIAFLGEIPDAEEWVWFAANVFHAVYPVWCDDDGGWHEGMGYWNSYIRRFTWWADVMKKAMGIDAFEKPYFAQAGFYPMYMMPPGQRGAGFGDLNGKRRSRDFVDLTAILAAQSGNSYWQWWVEAHGDRSRGKSYIDFLRGVLPPVPARRPEGLPASRLFRGTGQAVLNTTLLDAEKNVQILFKSSPFGTQSHGYEAQNAFLLNVFGERILVRSGIRDIYGSDHHRNWMWHTKSVNAITVNGQGQRKHSAEAKGRITGFMPGKSFDYVAGEAGEAYGNLVDRFTRRMLFVKPDLIVVHDLLEAPEASTFEWWLHAAHPMKEDARGDITVEGERGAARIAFLQPEELKRTFTDRFDPPPRERARLTQWHLEASTTEPARSSVFVTVIRPFRKGDEPPGRITLEEEAGVLVLEGTVPRGEVWIRLYPDGVAARIEGEVTAAFDSRPAASTPR